MVVVLIGIVAVVVTPNFIDFSDEAKSAVTQEKLVVIKYAIMGDPKLVSSGALKSSGYFSHMGSLPSTLNDLVVQGVQTTYDPFTKLGWRGPYLDNTSADWNLDGWKTAIIYSQVGRTITSCGEDGLCGNGDDIQISF
ncbi:MAG: hypothetical protein A2504_11530 [Bdellovibrionales bacterium RIFOXYD12_FULL_39_22]|nr:MAG: hypothetical protein A2385_16045 [Bdellovibrionales bacterium RIFOXYB1_FULL_39_21]OFZ44531.1 MAG: hypothetical protein A2485_06850 [Bdellovibrionales bacterium RIFOXYC12_FULL_39_17]OFZ49827.1 MAG: hypothetical protein A2404_00615 [Bdellovibrionales bacterium RIFOXYC1_FULL_39_130]OFZ76832.1 MAG: hypothetical protein A2560_05415 [Bdellovibrionales bacterium RIFOXYD1_FULL_39_84]OFZ95759.1 MAG: hypothetical protein A2504_11530 [Bdellovibrionales bacterium RIFOXYD12_FULL_39_22]